MLRAFGFPCAVVVCATAFAAAAQPPAPESLYTELLKGRCKFISIDPQTNEEQVKRCPGYGGTQVLTRASHTKVFLGFRWSRARAAEDLVAGWSLGDKVEWRGIRAGKEFRPYATIVRVITKDLDTLMGGGHVLAVFHMDQRNACLAAAVDVGANKEANALAREAADTFARTFTCGKDTPRLFGPSTAATEQVIGVDGPEPK